MKINVVVRKWNKIVYQIYDKINILQVVLEYFISCYKQLKQKYSRKNSENALKDCSGCE